MQHAARQSIRILFLAIGFVLFVVMTVVSASTATNRQAVAGKPNLMPAGSFASAGLLGSPAARIDSSLPTASSETVIARAPSPTSPASSERAEPSDNDPSPDLDSEHAEPPHTAIAASAVARNSSHEMAVDPSGTAHQRVR